MDTKQLSNLRKFANAVIPILEMVLMDQARCTVTDSNIFYRCAHRIDITGGPAVIPIQPFVNVLKSSTVKSIQVEEYDINILTDKGEFSLKGADPDEFPEVPEANTPSGITISNDLREWLNYSSTDDLRPAMCGVYYGGQHRVATDGMVMRWKEHSQSNDDPFILPNEAVKLMTKEVYDHHTGKDYHRLASPQEEIIYTPINEQFPNWQSVIPQDPEQIVHLDYRKSLEAIDAALSVIGEEHNKIEIHPQPESNDVLIYGCDIDLSQEYTSGPVGTYDTEKEPFKIAFNGKLLKKVLQDGFQAKKTKLMDPRPGKVTVELKNPNQAAIIEDTILLMPIMI